MYKPYANPQPTLLCVTRAPLSIGTRSWRRKACVVCPEYRAGSRQLMCGISTPRRHYCTYHKSVIVFYLFTFFAPPVMLVPVFRRAGQATSLFSVSSTWNGQRWAKKTSFSVVRYVKWAGSSRFFKPVSYTSSHPSPSVHVNIRTYQRTQRTCSLWNSLLVTRLPLW